MSGWLCLQHRPKHTNSIVPRCYLRWIRFIRAFRSEPALDCFYAFSFDESKIRRRRRRRRIVLLLKDKRRWKMGLIISLISSLSRYFGKVWSAEIHSCFSSDESNQLRLPRIKSRLPTKETELIPRLVFFYYGEWKRSNNGRFVSLVDTDDAIDGAQIKRSWGKSGAALFTYAPRCFMIIYGPDEYAPSGKLNNREEVFWQAAHRFFFLYPSSTDFAQDSR